MQISHNFQKERSAKINTSYELLTYLLILFLPSIFRWAMAKLNICESQFLSPHTNPQERFHRLCNYFHHWGSLSLEQLIRAFNYLFIFFVNELSLRDSGNGAFVLKTAYQPQFHGFNHPR